MAVSLSLFGCDKFPVSEVYISDLGAKTCASVKITRENPLEFGDAKLVGLENCEVIYGFKQDDVGFVTDWIRRNQKNKGEFQ